MSETRQERLKRLSDEYKALQQEIAQEQNNDPAVMRDTLYQLLYASIIRHGVAEAVPGIAVIQVPVVMPAKEHEITWSLADDKKSMFLRIVYKQQPQEESPPPPDRGVTIERPDTEAEQAMVEVMA